MGRGKVVMMMMMLTMLRRSVGRRVEMHSFQTRAAKSSKPVSRKSGDKEPRLTLELWRFCRKCSCQVRTSLALH